jgi:hypothetical protein
MDLVNKINNALRMGSRGVDEVATLSPSSAAVDGLRTFLHLTSEYSFMSDSHRKVMGTDVMRLAFSVRPIPPMHSATLARRLGFAGLVANFHYRLLT